MHIIFLLNIDYLQNYLYRDFRYEFYQEQTSKKLRFVFANQ